MPEVKTKLLYSIDEVVKLTGIGRQKIQEQIDSGRLKVFSLFGYTPAKISHIALMEWIESNQSYANQNLPQIFNRG